VSRVPSDYGFETNRATLNFQSAADNQIAERHRSRIADAQGCAMNKTEKRRDGTCAGEQSGPIELPVDDESGNGAEDQSGEHGAASADGDTCSLFTNRW
jgi:hypothetical protein